MSPFLYRSQTVSPFLFCLLPSEQWVILYPQRSQEKPNNPPPARPDFISSLFSSIWRVHRITRILIRVDTTECGGGTVSSSSLRSQREWQLGNEQEMGFVYHQSSRPGHSDVSKLWWRSSRVVSERRQLLEIPFVCLMCSEG